MMYILGKDPKQDTGPDKKLLIFILRIGIRNFLFRIWNTGLKCYII